MPQIVDYFGMFKSRFPDKAVELMIIANDIRPERRMACEKFHIVAVAIPQTKFRDVAEEVGYVFKSETTDPSAPPVAFNSPIGPELPPATEKSWYYWKAKDGRANFLAVVNAKGSCSLRRFEADGGAFLGREYKSGDYQTGFRSRTWRGTARDASHPLCLVNSRSRSATNDPRS